MLFYPVTDANFDTESYQRFATGYGLSRDTMKWYWDQYIPAAGHQGAAHGAAPGVGHHR